MNNWLIRTGTILVLAAINGVAWPQNPATPPAEPKSPETKAEPKKEEPKKDPKLEEYEKAIKDLPKTTGFFTMFQRKREFLAEIPESMIGKTFYGQAALNTGASTAVQAGFPTSWDSLASFRIEKNGDDRIVLMRNNTKFRWTDSSPWAVASGRQFPESIIADFKIEQVHPESKMMLVNVTPLFTGELFKVNEAVQGGLGRQFGLDRDLVTADSIRNSPNSLIVRMLMPYTAAPGGASSDPFSFLFDPSNNLENPRNAPIKVTYNYYWPQKSSYVPRISDPRVGYFTVDYTDIENRYLQDDRMTRLIIRWNFGGKKDPLAALSEPVRPMVWTLDTSIPVKYREACRMGIVSWNKAFEKLGYKNALQVVDAPTKEQDPTYDHADGTRNILRWSITNGSDGAIALFIPDPMTGEVLNTSINFDASWIPYGVNEYERLGVPASTINSKTAAKELTHSHSHDETELLFNYAWGFRDLQRDALNARLQQLGWTKCECSYGNERAARVASDLAALRAGGMQIPLDKYIDQAIANTVAHEVGHCLGLRHNFVSSTNLTLDQLKNESLMWDQGVAASLMDYTPANNVALLNGKGVFYTWDPGIYDYHAIKYGYQDFNAKKPQDEVAQLKAIAAQGSKRGLEYMTDEDADSVDPFVVRWDLGRDPVAYADTEYAIARKVRKYAITTMPRPGESFALRNQLVLNSVMRSFRTAAMMTRFIGGVQGSRAYYGDVDARSTLQPVSREIQVEAIKQIVRECLQPESIQIPDSVLLSLSGDYGSGAGSSYIAPIRTLISGRQELLVASLLRSSTALRMQENEFKLAGKPAYTLGEHYGNVTRAVYADLVPGKSLAALRRDLQRSTLALIIGQAEKSDNYELQDIATASLRSIQAKCSEFLAKPSKNSATDAHVKAMSEAIRMFFNRTRVEGALSGGGSGSLFPFMKQTSSKND
jgi:hypothetical protein